MVLCRLLANRLDTRTTTKRETCLSCLSFFAFVFFLLFLDFLGVVYIKKQKIYFIFKFCDELIINFRVFVVKNNKIRKIQVCVRLF